MGSVGCPWIRNRCTLYKRDNDVMSKKASRGVGLSRITALIIVFGIATVLATGMFVICCWASTLPAISPVSLSLVFRSWSAILTFTFHVWWVSLCVLALVLLPVFLRPRDQNVQDD